MESRRATREVTEMIPAKKDTEKEHRNGDKVVHECKQCVRVFKYKLKFGKHFCKEASSDVQVQA